MLDTSDRWRRASRSRPPAATRSPRCNCRACGRRCGLPTRISRITGLAFEQAGVHPDDLHSLDDLRRFPFTTKDDLRANYPFGMFAVPRKQVVRIHASSGTTGKPTVVGYTSGDIDTWAELVARSSARPAAARATSCTSPMATACSPAASASITAPNAWAPPWCPYPAGRPPAR